MGGAPWRSSGCNTCVKRKVKCDLQRPQCARCLRGGHHCGGYERSRKFIHTFAEPRGSGNNVLSQGQSQVVDLAAVNVNAQIRSQLFSLFVDSYEPSQPVGQVNWRCQHATNIVQDFPFLMGRENSQLFDQAVTALASSFVGKKYGDERFTRHGIMLYNKSIQTFARLLPRSSIPVQEILCANVAFQLFEVINCTYGFMGWMAHVQGANAMLARHEKSMGRNQVSTLLLRQLKLSNIFHAIGKSKSALDYLPTWRSLSPVDNELLDEIIDILMECTGLVEDAGNMQSDIDVQRVAGSCWDLNNQLTYWYGRLGETIKGPLYTDMSSEIDSLQQETPPFFQQRYYFVSVEVAESHMLYWAASLIIQSLFYEFERRKEDFRDESSRCPSVVHDGSDIHKFGSSSYLADAKFHADQICCGIGYFLQTHMHILGGHSLLFPIAMASQFFHMNGFHDDFDRCQEVFKFLESSGLGIASVLLGTPWSRYKSGGSLEQ